MLYYLYSPICCHVKKDGEYVGRLNKNPKFFEGDFKLLEFIPVKSEYSPCIADYKHLENVICVEDKLGKIIIPTYKRQRYYGYEVIDQQQISSPIGEILITTLLDGEYKFFLQSTSASSFELSFKPERVTASVIGSLLVISFTAVKTSLFVFDLSNGSPVLRLKKVVNSFTLTNELNVETTIPSITSLSELTTYSLNGELTEKEKVFKRGKSIFALSQQIIPFAFLEEYLLGANYVDYLNGSMRQNANMLKGFLENFILALPLGQEGITLVYKKHTKLLKVYLEGGYISDLVFI